MYFCIQVGIFLTNLKKTYQYHKKSLEKIIITISLVEIGKKLAQPKINSSPNMFGVIRIQILYRLTY